MFLPRRSGITPSSLETKGQRTDFDYSLIFWLSFFNINRALVFQCNALLGGFWPPKRNVPIRPVLPPDHCTSNACAFHETPINTIVSQPLVRGFYSFSAFNEPVLHTSPPVYPPNGRKCGDCGLAQPPGLVRTVPAQPPTIYAGLAIRYERFVNICLCLFIHLQASLETCLIA